MADGRTAGGDGDRGGLDRVAAPDPARPRRGDTRGKRALYSVDEEATPTPALIVRCPRCGVQRSLTVKDSIPLFRPPFIVEPLTRRLWTRCPTCRRRTWLNVRLGAGIPWPTKL